MPELQFKVTGVEAIQHGLVPLLHFKVRVDLPSPQEQVQGLILQAQIQIAAPQRHYDAEEKERLFEIFGKPEHWGQTLRNRFWTQANTTTGPFTGSTEAVLPVPCTFDLNVLATKYFQALGTGEVPLLFLFSGSVFYMAKDGRLQVQRVSWEKECPYRVPLSLWRELMERHYPDSAWVSLRRDVFDRLWSFKRSHGLVTWEETIERLLPEAQVPQARL
jgi:hypothetical protein